MDFSARAVGGNVTDRIDANRGLRIYIQRRLELIRELRILVSAGDKCVHEAFEVLRVDRRREINAGQFSRGEHFDKAFFRGAGLNGRAVDQQLFARDSQGESGICFGGQRAAQIREGRLVLSGSALVLEAVHPGRLQQDVQRA